MITPSKPPLRLCLPLSILLAACTQAQVLRLTPDRSNGFYRAGETVRWQVITEGPVSNEVSYVIRSGGLIEIARGKATLAAGTGEIESRLAEPGTLLVEATAAGKTGETIHALSGAVFSAEKIQPAAPRPTDFDRFWQAKLDELAAVPTNAVLTPMNCGKTNVDYWQISMDNIRGTHLRGQFARPKQGERLPAILLVNGAGIYALPTNWVTDHAAAGWLSLNINAHDLPIDQPDAFYKEQSARFACKDYKSIGADRETSYFLRMYLACYRAADYLAHRPDWDGKTLVATGGSQGGLQSFVAAALHPRITAALADVPAGCDLSCANAGRAPSWPMWFYGTNSIATNAVLEAGRYYDTVNFASRIRCPMLVSIGLIDQVCPPAGVFAACNQLAGPKEIVLLTNAGHRDLNRSHAPYRARFDVWLDALRQGQAPPVRSEVQEIRRQNSGVSKLLEAYSQAILNTEF